MYLVGMGCPRYDVVMGRGDGTNSESLRVYMNIEHGAEHSGSASLETQPQRPSARACEIECSHISQEQCLHRRMITATSKPCSQVTLLLWYSA